MRTYPRLRTLLTAALLLPPILSGCDDDQGPTPVGAILAPGLAATAEVGTPITLRLRIEDDRGQPLSGVGLSLSVAEEHGTVSPDTATTGSAGEVEVRWHLGTRAGEQLLQVRARDASRTLRIESLPGAPSRALILAGNQQTGTVSRPLSDRIRIRIQDRWENGVPGQEVRFAPRGEEAGTTSPATATTDAEGVAATRWTLGTAAREQVLDVTLNGLGAAVRAEARADAPARAQSVSGDGQRTSIVGDFPEPLALRVVDDFGNPVPDTEVRWSVVRGDASVDSPTSLTDHSGLATMGFRTGTAFGELSVEARVAGLAPVIFTAFLVESNLVLEGLYLNQSIQTFGGTVPLVAGRDGWIRVFVRANSINALQPDVVVRLWQDGVVVETHRLEAGQPSVRMEVTEADLSASWNLFVPGDLIQPGFGISAMVDPDDQIPESDEADNAFPANGMPTAEDVRVVSDFRARLVPIHIQSFGATGRVSDDNLDEWMSEVFAMMPMAAYDAEVREPFSGDITDVNEPVQWGRFLSEINALRVAEGSGRYYYGVLPARPGAPFCGLGYLGVAASIGLDACGASTAAHEWGHNWNRSHTPCGDPGGVDPNYPYSNATLGAWGMHAASGQLRPPSDYRDLMSYCSPEWVSDYTFEAVLAWRENEDQQGAALRASPEPTLVVWGRITPEGLELEPAFRTTTRPALPSRGGRYRLRGEGSGRTLFDLSFDAVPVDHLPEGHRHFAFAIPERMASPELLERMVLEGPEGPAAVQAPSASLRGEGDAAEPGGEGGIAHLEAARLSGGRVRVTWDASVAPMLVVRSARTGAILSFARGGEAVIATGSAEVLVELAGGRGGERVVPVR